MGLFDWIYRLPRPLLLWMGVIMCAVAIRFMVRVLDSIALAFERAADQGVAVPNMDGGMAALITAGGGAAVTVGGFIWQVLRNRSAERIEEIRVGAGGGSPPNPPAPAADSPPSPASDDVPGGGLVNNQAIQ